MYLLYDAMTNNSILCFKLDPEYLLLSVLEQEDICLACTNVIDILDLESGHHGLTQLQLSLLQSENCNFGGDTD